MLRFITWVKLSDVDGIPQGRISGSSQLASAVCFEIRHQSQAEAVNGWALNYQSEKFARINR